MAKKKSGVQLNIEIHFLDGSEIRFIGAQCGEHEGMAYWRVSKLWRQCYLDRKDTMNAKEINIYSEWFKKDGKCFAEILFDACLAEKDGDRFKLRGVAGKIQSLKEYDAGRTDGGKARSEGAERDENGRFKPKNTSSTPAGHQLPTSSTPGQSQEASSVTSSYDPDYGYDYESGNKEIQVKPPKKSRKKPESETPEAKALRSRAWREYHDAYVLKYRTEPIRDAKANTHIKQICDRVGEDGPGVLKFFLTVDKDFYRNKAHELSLCLADLQALMAGMKTGNMPVAVRGSPTRLEKASSYNQSIYDKYDAIERGLNESGSSDSEAS